MTRNGVGPVLYRQTSTARRPSQRCLGRCSWSVRLFGGKALELLGLTIRSEGGKMCGAKREVEETAGNRNDHGTETELPAAWIVHWLLLKAPDEGKARGEPLE